MDIIIKWAKDLASQHITDGCHYPEEVVNATRTKLHSLHDHLDKVKFLNKILEINNLERQQHFDSDCDLKENCPEILRYDSVNYDLNGDLKQLGIVIDSDAFTTGEKAEAEDKLDRILNELQTLKNGHQIIYDQLVYEINELRALLFLGKKKWYRQLGGTIADSVKGGLIDEFVTKKIIDIIKNEFSKFLE